MSTTTLVKHRHWGTLTEILVDGEIWKTIEEYKDDEGNVVYVREDYPTSGAMLKNYKDAQVKNDKNDKNDKKKVDQRAEKFKKKLQKK